MKRWLGRMVMIGTIVGVGMSGHVAEAAYRDVPATYRFASSIDVLRAADMVDDGLYFRPTQRATRAETAELLVRLAEKKPAPRPTRFKDVPRTHPSSGYIEAAVENGFISGFPDGTFRPDAPVTRGQFALMLMRTYPYTHSPFFERAPRQPFKDVTRGMRAHDLITQMTAHRIAGGFPDGTFRPDAPIERGQLAYFVERAMERSYENMIALTFIQRGGFADRYGEYLLLEAVETMPTGDVRFTLSYKNVHTSTGKTTLGRYGYDDTTDHYYDVTLAQQTGQKTAYRFETFQ